MLCDFWRFKATLGDLRCQSRPSEAPCRSYEVTNVRFREEKSKFHQSQFCVYYCARATTQPQCIYNHKHDPVRYRLKEEHFKADLGETVIWETF